MLIPVRIRVVAALVITFLCFYETYFAYETLQELFVIGTALSFVLIFFINSLFSLWNLYQVEKNSDE